MTVIQLKNKQYYEINYISLKHIFRNTGNSRSDSTYSVGDVFSDHNSLVGNIRVRLKKLRITFNNKTTEPKNPNSNGHERVKKKVNLGELWEQ